MEPALGLKRISTPRDLNWVCYHSMQELNQQCYRSSSLNEEKAKNTCRPVTEVIYCVHEVQSPFSPIKRPVDTGQSNRNMRYTTESYKR